MSRRDAPPKLGGRMDAGDARKVTRRTMLTGAGAVAGGVAISAAGSTVLATAATADGVGSGGLATGATGTTVVEFRSRIAQTGNTGQQFASYGYLSSVAGARRADLFATATTSEATALFTAYSTGALTMRTLDTNVHVLDVAGDLTVYQRDAPGASWDDPGSFADGVAVARFTLTLQDVLTVFAPAQGLPTLTGDMLQTGARRVSNSGGQVFGRAGQRLRFFATGRGTLLDAATSNSMLEIGGNWSAE
jgi:hypothetical protein